MVKLGEQMEAGDVVLTAEDVGALSEDSLGDAVDEALDSRLATDNEVNEMIADVFSLEPGQVPDGDVATDQEVDEMLNEVFENDDIEVIPPSLVASDGEVSEMLDEVF